MSNATSPVLVGLDGNVTFRYYESPSSLYGAVVTCLSLLAFGCLNLLICYKATPEVLPNYFRRWEWQNTFVSCVHAAISGTAAIIGLFLYTEMLQDMINYNNYHVYTLTSFVLGYFIYDTFHTIVGLRGSCYKRWEVLLHHAVSIGLMAYMVSARHLAANTTFTMFAEVNSVFLHLRKLMQLVKVDYRKWYYRAVIALNLVTFVIFRGVAFGWLIVAVCLWWTKVNIVAYVLAFNCTFVLFVMNVIFFWRLLKRDALGKGPKTNLNNNNNNAHAKKTT